MHVALNEKLASLPDDTVTYVGHEYTASNVAFSKKIEPDNEAIQKLEKYCNENEVTTGKFTIGDEKQHNVFMRTDNPAVQSAYHILLSQLYTIFEANVLLSFLQRLPTLRIRSKRWEFFAR